MGVPDWAINDYYYRIFSPDFGVVSNVLQIARIYLILVGWGLDQKPVYRYSYSGFLATELIFQYSQNGVDWTNLPSNDVDGLTNPGVVPNFETIDYKYRIIHAPTNTYSNVRRYRGFELMVNSVEANGTEVKVFSTQHGFPESGFNVLYQYSKDGIDWRNSDMPAKYEDVKTISVPMEYKLIKIYEPVNDVSSNIVDLKR